MSGQSIKAPPLFFAPFVSSTMQVEPAWIDYNGHLNMAYYNVLFDRALEEAFVPAGLGSDYTKARGLSYFTAECHVVYKRELKAEDAVRSTLQLIDYDDKRLHYYMELRHATEGWISATSEGLSLHVDMKARRVVPFPPDILANLAGMRAAHALMTRPASLGRVIGLGQRSGKEPERVLN